MASSLRGTVIGLGLIAQILFATGCTSGNKSKSARVVPAPSFDGPRIARNNGASRDITSERTRPASWQPKAPARAWRWIVIHHSATPAGAMALFDKEHRAKGWDGVGYHFVIGNGTSSADGQIEVTPRWPVQKWGAHAKTIDNRYNEYGIGICLVGNFDSSRPSSKQVQSLTKLVAHLMATYRIPAQNVIGHRDTKATECPGRNLDLAAVRSMAARGLADAGATGADDELLVPSNAQTAGVQLTAD